MVKLLVAVLLITGVAYGDTAEIVFFRGLMSPQNEVPAVNLQAGAAATIICHIVRDPAGKIASASVDFLVGYQFPQQVTFTGLHIHKGDAGANGPIVIRTSLGTPAAPSEPGGAGLINQQAHVLPADQTGLDALAGMIANPGQYYVNVHTTAFPGGVARAQLNRATFVVPMTLMTPSKIVPAAPGDATAASQLVVLTARDSAGAITSTQLIFDVNYNFGKKTTITGLHVHRGSAGANGPIAIESGLGEGFFPPVTTDESGSGTLRQFAEVDLRNPEGAAFVDAMLSHPRDYYMDVHTTDAPGGAVRDQIQPTDIVRYRTTMTAPGDATPSASAPTLLVLHALRAEDGTPLAGSLMWISNYRFPGKTTFTGLDVYDGAAGTTGPQRLVSTVCATQPYPTETGFGTMFFFTTISDAAGLATLNSMTRDPENHYIAILTGSPGTVAVRAQMGPQITDVPLITAAGNSATGGPVGPGGLISIYGNNLSKLLSDPFDARVSAIPALTAWFGKALPASYDGTSVTIGGKKAGLIWVAPGQINAVVPFDLAQGRRQVVVSNANGAGQPFEVSVGTGYAPAIFAGSTDPVVFKARDGSLVSAANPVSTGDVLYVYATGLGQTIPALADGEIVPLGREYQTVPITAKIGNIVAPVARSIAAPGYAGSYQVTVTVPPGLVAGTAKLQLQAPVSPLVIFGAPNYAASSTVDIAIR